MITYGITRAISFGNIQVFNLVFCKHLPKQFNIPQVGDRYDSFTDRYCIGTQVYNHYGNNDNYRFYIYSDSQIIENTLSWYTTSMRMAKGNGLFDYVPYASYADENINIQFNANQNTYYYIAIG